MITGLQMEKLRYREVKPLAQCHTGWKVAEPGCEPRWPSSSVPASHLTALLAPQWHVAF